jgi:hypothetical protein
VIWIARWTTRLHRRRKQMTSVDGITTLILIFSIFIAAALLYDIENIIIINIYMAR